MGHKVCIDFRATHEPVVLLLAEHFGLPRVLVCFIGINLALSLSCDLACLSGYPALMLLTVGGVGEASSNGVVEVDGLLLSKLDVCKRVGDGDKLDEGRAAPVVELLLAMQQQPGEPPLVRTRLPPTPRPALIQQEVLQQQVRLAHHFVRQQHILFCRTI